MVIHRQQRYMIAYIDVGDEFWSRFMLVITSPPTPLSMLKIQKLSSTHFVANRILVTKSVTNILHHECLDRNCWSGPDLGAPMARTFH